MPKLRRWGKCATALLLSASVLVPAANVIAQELYTVSPGDTIYDIANSYGVSVEEIQSWNGLSSPYIDVNDQLIIYGTGQGEEIQTPAPAPTTTSAVSDGIYTVQPGDTLSGIAAQCGVTVEELYAWNGLQSSYLDVGDQLAVVPTGAPVAPPASSDYYYDDSYVVPETGVAGYHTVTAGETLWDLAWYYGTTVETLMAMNGLSSDYLDVGMTLAVPNAPVNDYYYEPVLNDYEVPTGTAENSTTTNDGSTAHVVQPGDSLSSIAVTYGVTVDNLYTWNNLSSDWLNVGDQIIVAPAGPVESAPAQEEVVEVTDSNGDTTEVDLNEIPEAARPDTHVVAEGENIWSIAQQYDISAASIRVWNNLPAGDDSLTIGQEIYVSNPAFVPQIHEVAEGEDLNAIATEYETTVENIVSWNDLTDETSFEVGDQLIVSDPEPVTHTVEPGETLEDIATEYNVTVEELREWNFIPDESDIVNGTLIVSDPTGVTRNADAEEGSSDETSASSASDESVAEDETTTTDESAE